MPEPTQRKIKAIGYKVDGYPGVHRYAAVEGVGECRDVFRRMLDDLERDTRNELGALAVYKVELLFLDASPMWMEKFIRLIKRKRMIIGNAMRNAEFNLNDPEQEAASRALCKKEGS